MCQSPMCKHNFNFSHMTVVNTRGGSAEARNRALLHKRTPRAHQHILSLYISIPLSHILSLRTLQAPSCRVCVALTQRVACWPPCAEGDSTVRCSSSATTLPCSLHRQPLQDSLFWRGQRTTQTCCNTCC